MGNRIKDCLCHPKWIGKYFKDRIWSVFLMLVLFFGCYAAVSAARAYTTAPFTSESASSLVSTIYRNAENDIYYQAEDHELYGTSTVYQGPSFSMYFLSEEVNYQSEITIVFDRDSAAVYEYNLKIGQVFYRDLRISSFSLANVKKYQSADVYEFGKLAMAVLESSFLYYQSAAFLYDLGVTLAYYLMIVLVLCFFSVYINPGIELKIRIKLCFYDALVYFAVCMFSVLFGISWLSYVAFIVPVIYNLITFKHIIKVVIRK